MPKLTVFNQVSLDGYFTGENGDLSWAHTRETEDPEWKSFVEGNAEQGGLLVFGRVTYEMMVSYWPTPEALENDPVVAGQMNALPKLVFSKSLARAAWNNTTLVRDDPSAELRRLKDGAGPDMVIFGSGTIVSQAAQAGLIDEYQLIVKPVVLGKGRTMFEGVKNRPTLMPTTTRTFRNGNILLCYEPKADAAPEMAPERSEARGRPVTAG